MCQINGGTLAQATALGQQKLEFGDYNGNAVDAVPYEEFNAFVTNVADWRGAKLVMSTDRTDVVSYTAGTGSGPLPQDIEVQGQSTSVSINSKASTA